MDIESNEVFEPSAPPVIGPPPIDWRAWTRRLLVCNPFFLCSAALLLFGVTRLSLDPNFLPQEQTNLLFNYSSLQFYELLVVGAAIILARRKIWYDSSLLVVVEHGLAFVPFMLISQGALLSPRLGTALALGAVLMTMLRGWAIRRAYPLFNLPPRVLCFGAVLLLVNAALPCVFPPMVENNPIEEWAIPNLVLWYVVLPLLVGGANLLPRPTRYGGLNPERHWLPLFVYALWGGGTGTHFWCLGYIGEQPFQIHYLAPAACIAAWTLWRRIPDCVQQPGARWEMAMLCLTFASPLVAFGEPTLFAVLALMNAAVYAMLLRRRAGTTQRLLRELLIGSAALLVLGLPENIGRLLLPEFTRMHALVLAAATAVFTSALRSRRMAVGFAAAVGAGISVALIFPNAPAHLTIETAAVFLLAHSLGWSRRDAAASFLRIVAGGLWVIDAGISIHTADWQTDVAIGSIALALSLAWWVVGRFYGERRHWIVLASSVAVILALPSDWLWQSGSPGLIALAASLALFVVGFVIAWTRHLWERINHTMH
jgi:hypothetical protein